MAANSTLAEDDEVSSQDVRSLHRDSDQAVCDPIQRFFMLGVVLRSSDPASLGRDADNRVSTLSNLEFYLSQKRIIARRATGLLES